MSSKVLKTVVFMGSARDILPPWGGTLRLGDRVLAWVLKELAARSKLHGADLTVTHEVTVLDPKEIFGPGGALAESGGELRQPTFFLPKDSVPPAVQALIDTVRSADSYIVVSAEYNHTIPPALSGLMSHFGGSCYAMKPCGIVTYSPGNFGGVRAAMALRPFLAELGCISASKVTALPQTGELLTEDGTPVDAANRSLGIFGPMLDQVEFIALAMIAQKAIEPVP